MSIYQSVGGRLFGDLMVGGLVFISGYTHFTYYWKCADFTWKRLATVSNALYHMTLQCVHQYTSPMFVTQDMHLINVIHTCILAVYTQVECK